MTEAIVPISGVGFEKVGNMDIATARKEFYQIDARPVPIPLVQEVLNNLPYASPLRIGFQILFYTGCRIRELDTMQVCDLKENWIYWHVGKNQHGIRHEYLPDSFISEYFTYRERNKGQQSRFFFWSSATFRRHFNSFRQNLSEEWQQKTPSARTINTRGKQQIRIKEEYTYQLKGLRKNFATLLFHHFSKEYKSGEMAMYLTSAKMKHASTGMTVMHYLTCVRHLRAESYEGLLPFDCVKKQSQERLFNWV